MTKVAVGLSGGVDSAVTAHLLKEQKYEVFGVFVGMSDMTDSQSAREVAGQLGISLAEVDITKEFQHEVMDYFVDEYLRGRTPNPCCQCNRFAKIHALRRWADENDVEYIATGHYAEIVNVGRFSLQNVGKKDQTYALYNLSQEQLEKTLMPLKDYSKEEIRRMALECGLKVADKPDSQDICFIPDGDYAKFLRQYIEEKRPELLSQIPREGNFISEEGKILGKHTGFTDYTIGQRKGLNVSTGHRMFVKCINPKTNEVILSDEDVFGNEIEVSNINFMAVAGIDKLHEGDRFFTKIRYAHRGQWGTVEKINYDNGVIKFTFEEPVRAITPGQAAVFYNSDSDDRYIMFGGSILK